MQIGQSDFPSRRIKSIKQERKVETCAGYMRKVHDFPVIPMDGRKLS